MKVKLSYSTEALLTTGSMTERVYSLNSLYDPG